MNSNANALPVVKPSLYLRVDRFICSYWLPAGFFIFLIGFFFAPSQHQYKIIVADLLLLPALFSSLAPSAWARALRQGPVLGLVIAYLVYMALDALLLQTEDAAEFVKWGAYILLFLIAVGTRMAITEHRLRCLLIASAAVAASAALFALAHDFRAGALHHPDYRLVGYGTLYNPLRSGDVFGAFALIALWGALTTDIKSLRTLAFGASAICFVAVVLTGSRSPLAALFVAGICATLLESNRRRRVVWTGAIGVVVGLVALLYWSGLSERGTSFRPEIWTYVWRLCLQHIWFGVGLDTPLVIPVSSGVTQVDTHNVLLAALFYGGLFGLLLFCAAFFSSVLFAWRLRRRSSLAALASMLQLYGLVTLQFDGGCLISRPNDFWILYWLPIALYLRAVFYTADANQSVSRGTI